MNDQERTQRQRLEEIGKRMSAINTVNFGEAEEQEWNVLKSEKQRIQAWLGRNAEVAQTPVGAMDTETRAEDNMTPRAPAHHKRSTADHPDAIMCRYIRTGDEGAKREMDAAARSQYRNGEHVRHPFKPELRYNPWAEVYQQLDQELRASNDTSMNIATAADGANLVPTGHYNRIVARNDEMALRNRLALMPIPGKGTTVNVPIDNEADGEFVSTAEQVDAHTNNFDRDAPAIDKVQNTLVKYTKKIELTDELLEDNDSNLLQWLEYRVGVGLAKTNNNLIVTEALANGTAALTLDAAAAIGVSEIPELVYAQAEGYEDGSVWVMKKASLGYLKGLKGDNFQLVDTPAGSGGPRELWGFPAFTTAKMPAIGAGNKSMIFGNFGFMGYREMPGLTLLRDPYTVDGMVILKYYYRVDYNVLQAAAITYATHPTA